MNRAVFLDRDGTIIEEREYLHRPEEVALLVCRRCLLSGPEYLEEHENRCRDNRDTRK